MPSGGVTPPNMLALHPQNSGGQLQIVPKESPDHSSGINPK